MACLLEKREREREKGANFASLSLFFSCFIRRRERKAGRQEPRGQHLCLGVTCSPALHSLLGALLCRNPRPQLQRPLTFPGLQRQGLAGILPLHSMSSLPTAQGPAELPPLLWNCLTVLSSAPPRSSQNTLFLPLLLHRKC